MIEAEMRRGLKRLLGFRPADELVLRPMIAPFGVAIFSVLVIVAENPNTGVRVMNLTAPLFLALAITWAVWIASRSVTGNADARGILSAVVVALGLFFAPVSAVAGNVIGALGRMLVGFLVIVLAALFVIVLRAVRRRRITPAPVTYFLSVSTLVLVSVTGVRAAIVLAGHGAPVAEPAGFEPFGDAAAVEEYPDGQPDVFIVIVDGYASPEVMLDVYDLDMTSFVDSLESLGYEMPRGGRANYGQTYLSLASMLDWGYLHEEMLAAGSERAALSLAFSKLHDNRTMEFLRGRGYRTIYFRSSYPPLNHHPWADVHVPNYLVTDLEITWFSATLLPTVIAAVCRVVNCGRGGLGFTPEAPDVLQDRFRLIESVPDEGPPVLVFAHILLPHEPFVFTSDCSTREPLLPRSVPPELDALVRSAYRDQVACLNRFLLPFAETLASGRRRPALIILQSDHGYGRLGLGWSDSLEEAGDERVRDRMSVFAAYRRPTAAVERLPDDVTPINAFRILFGTTFGLPLETLPDSSFWASYGDPLAFEPWVP